MKTIIVIPVYKKELKPSEKASLEQCAKVLNHFQIEIIYPQGLDISNCEDVLKECGASYSFRVFDKKYFGDVFKYSHLLLDKDFYKLYSDYDFMLLYQLDAWVFKDELDYWANIDYDYIGAPWFEDVDDENSKIIERSGNGGFSLRKISSMIELLSTDYHVVLSLKEFFRKKKKERLVSNIISAPFMFLKWLFQPDRFSTFWHNTDMYEDQAIVYHSEYAMPKFKVALADENYKFSFEVHPQRLYKMNNNELPFGCHAFERYDFEFFKTVGGIEF